MVSVSTAATRALRSRVLLPVVCGVAALAWAAIAVSHARSYHYLADDFALVAQASEASYWEIFTRDLFTVYRPLAFLLMKSVAATIAPSMSGWSALVLLLHGCNALLVATITLRIAGRRGAAGLAGVLFLISPWSAEAYFWLSGIFDVGATLCTLVAAWLALNFLAESRVWPLWALAIAGVCAAAAIFKESGVLSPLIVGGLLLARDAQAWRSCRTWVSGAVALLAVAGVLLARNAIVSSSSTYTVQAFSELLLAPRAAASFVSNILALWVWPVPDTTGTAGRMLNLLIVWPVGFALIPVLIASAMAGLRGAVPLALTTVGSFALTAFYHFTVATITPRRYLYLAGVSFSVLLALALAHPVGSVATPRRRAALAAVVLVAALGAVQAQARLWEAASRIARCAIEDFETRVLPVRGPVYVDNMPFVIDNGPFILLDYDFYYTYRERWEGKDIVYRTAGVTLGRGGVYEVASYGSDPEGVDGRQRISLDLCLAQTVGQVRHTVGQVRRLRLPRGGLRLPSGGQETRR